MADNEFMPILLLSVFGKGEIATPGKVEGNELTGFTLLPVKDYGRKATKPSHLRRVAVSLYRNLYQDDNFKETSPM